MYVSFSAGSSKPTLAKQEKWEKPSPVYPKLSRFLYSIKEAYLTVSINFKGSEKSSSNV